MVSFLNKKCTSSTQGFGFGRAGPPCITSRLMRPPQILIVEDCEGFQELFFEAFAEQAPTAAIVALNSGGTARSFIANGNGAIPDLILLDLNLPEVHGIELLRQIRTSPRLKPVPTVIITTSHDDRDRERCFDLGAVGFYPKPSTYSETLEFVSDLTRTFLAHLHVKEARAGH